MGEHIQQSITMNLLLISVFLYQGIAGQTTTPEPPPETTTTHATPECSHGWFDFNQVGLGCLFFDTDISRTWDDAQEFCFRQEGSFLVEVLNEDQNDDVLMMVFQIASLTGVSRNWWIGATDISFEGRWFWPHSLEPMDYNFWHGTEPNNGENYNYAYMAHTYEYEWMDTSEATENFAV